MSNSLYYLALIMVILWAVGFLGFNIGGVIHLLLVVALISVLLRVIRGNRSGDVL